MNKNLTPEEIQYRRQLLDDRWRRRRDVILTRDGSRCRCCGGIHQLQVHHRQYHVDAVTGAWKAPWEYEDRLLVTLCERCHSAGHQQYRIPVFSIPQKRFRPANRMQPG